MDTFTIWWHQQQLGETTFELHPDGKQRAGTFYPTPLGTEVLPQITAMVPALFDFGELCRREGYDGSNDDPDAGATAMHRFQDAPETLRLCAAARAIAALELKDRFEKTMPWRSILISDIRDILRLAAAKGTPSSRERATSAEMDSLSSHYMISVTLGSSGPRTLSLPPLSMAMLS